MTESQRENLRDVGYMGSYILTPSTGEICFRTQVAVRSVLLTANEWEYFMGAGEDLAGDKSESVQKWLNSSIENLVREAKENIEHVTTLMKASDNAAKQARAELVVERWKQIKRALELWLRA